MRDNASPSLFRIGLGYGSISFPMRAFRRLFFVYNVNHGYSGVYLCDIIKLVPDQTVGKDKFKHKKQRA